VTFSPGHALTGSYDFYLVALSVLIAIFASYAALDLAGRVTSSHGVSRSMWLAGGATAMGIGIWSMHYVGMLAFRLPIPVRYDWPVVLVSLLAAIFASASALFVVSRAKMGPGALFVGSMLMGGGIAAMHYIGMHAMRLQAVCSFSAWIVAASIFLAVVISAVALWLAFYFREETKSGGWQKVLSAIVMGAAIPVMHYTGMAAAGFTASPEMNSSLAHALNVSALGTTGVVVVTFMVLGLSIITSQLDRRISAHALELASSEKRSRQILETSFDAFAGLDSSGRIIDWNAQAESCFGWPRAEVLGKILSEIIMAPRHREHYEQCVRELLTANHANNRNTRFEIVANHKDGSEIPAEMTISVVGRGENCHLAAFVRDLTERKRFEHELRESKQTAEVANEAKSDFLASMSHEIRTPMNGILGMTELVLETELTSEQRENLRLVQISAESLLSIINDILDFSKIEAGKVDIEKIPFDLRESIGETMRSLSIRAKQKGLELGCEVQPEVPEGVIGDPGRIRQVLINLVGNAIKFTAKGGVSVHVEQEERESSTRLHFKIQDTGVGIAEDKVRQIFEPFSQADGSITRRFGGTGLGLTPSARGW
jgi:two-component system sensor histidine kinase/response regulator